MRMLIVEDDRKMQQGLVFAFQKEGYEVEAAETVRELERILFGRKDFDILILDCNLPDGDGFEVCRKLKKEYGFPTILLTARDMEEEMVEGFLSGADDYVTKPFSLAVLRMRVKAVRKRREEVKVLCAGDIRVSLDECRVFCQDKECRLGKTEYELLTCFLRNKNQLLSRERLFEAVWSSKERFVDDNSISMAVSRLRQKIKTAGKHIQTVHGMGYVWKDE